MRGNLKEVGYCIKMGKFKSEICEGCKKSLESGSLLKHISHKKDCKIVYGDRYIDMLNENRKATQCQNHLKNKKERNEKKRKSSKAMPTEKESSELKDTASEVTKPTGEKKSVIFIPIKYDATCKECGKSIKQQHFFNHVSNSKKCKEAYGEDFIKNHKISNQKYHMKNYISKQNNKLIEEFNAANDSDDEDNDLEEMVFKCNGCKIDFIRERFFKHVSHAKKCKAAYSDEEWKNMMKGNRKFLNWRNHFENKKERREKMKSHYAENKKDFVSRRHKRERVEKEKDELQNLQNSLQFVKEVYQREPDSIFDRELGKGIPLKSRLQLYKEKIQILYQKCSTEEKKNQLSELEMYIKGKLKAWKDEYDNLIKEIEEKTGKWKNLSNSKICEKECSFDKEFVRHILCNFNNFLKSEGSLLNFHSHTIVIDIAKKMDMALKEPHFRNQYFITRCTEFAPKIALKQKENEVKYDNLKEMIRKKHQDKEFHENNLLESLKETYDPVGEFLF